MVKATAKEVAEPVDKGIYKAKIVGEEVEERVIDPASGKKAQYINFQWEITDGPNAGQTIEESVPLNFSKKSSLGKLWKDLKGETMEGGQEYDTADLQGLEAQLTVDKEVVQPKSPDKTPFEVNRVKAHLVSSSESKTDGETVQPEETTNLSEAEQEHLEEAESEQKKLGE